jgi:hypothetical protein
MDFGVVLDLGMSLGSPGRSHVAVLQHELAGDHRQDARGGRERLHVALAAPPQKASGDLSVGYDLWDPFDIGGNPQRTGGRTRYGTEEEMLRMIQARTATGCASTSTTS